MQIIFGGLIVLAVLSVVGMSEAFAQESLISVQTNDRHYQEGDVIVISGQVSEIIENTIITLQVFTDGNLVEIAQVIVAQDGSYSHTLLAEGPLWKEQGEYTARVSYGVGTVAETEFSYVLESKLTKYGFDMRLDRQGTFDVEYTITGGTLFNIIPDKDFLSLIFSIDTYNNEVLVVELPRDLIDSKFNNKDDPFVILIDGNESNFTEIQTNFQIRTLRIDLPAGFEEIEIIGSKLGNDEKSISQEPSIIVTTDKSSTISDNHKDTIKNLKETIRDLKHENRDLKQKITTLQSEIDELKDLLINGLKEIYNWKSNNS